MSRAIITAVFLLSAVACGAPKDGNDAVPKDAGTDAPHDAGTNETRDGGDVVTPDGGDRDAGTQTPDGGEVPRDGGAAPVTVPSAVFSTIGGGAASSARYAVELRAGAPQPNGRAASASYGARLGPVTR